MFSKVDEFYPLLSLNPKGNILKTKLYKHVQNIFIKRNSSVIAE